VVEELLRAAESFGSLTKTEMDDLKRAVGTVGYFEMSQQQLLQIARLTYRQVKRLNKQNLNPYDKQIVKAIEEAKRNVNDTQKI